MPKNARNDANEEAADIVRNLSDCYWGGFFLDGSSERFAAIAAANQKLLHQSLLLLRDSMEVTSETIPIFFPLFHAITNPSSQLFTAMETVLFSRPFEVWLDSSNDWHDPATTLRFMDDWTPALRFFSERFEIEHPNRYADTDLHAKGKSSKGIDWESNWYQSSILKDFFTYKYPSRPLQKPLPPEPLLRNPP